MRYGFTDVMKGRFVMLLADSWCSKIGAKCGESGGVKRPYFVVRRGRRDDFEKSDFEAISDQNIGFRGVADEAANEVANEVAGGGEGGEGNAIDVAGAEEVEEVEVKEVEKGIATVGSGVANAIDVRNCGEGEKANAIDVKDCEEGGEAKLTAIRSPFGFFACFVRTCSCSLMLLSNLLEQRLHV